VWFVVADHVVINRKNAVFHFHCFGVIACTVFLKIVLLPGILLRAEKVVTCLQQQTTYLVSACVPALGKLLPHPLSTQPRACREKRWGRDFLNNGGSHRRGKAEGWLLEVVRSSPAPRVLAKLH